MVYPHQGVGEAAVGRVVPLNELALEVGGGLQQLPDQACSRGGPGWYPVGEGALFWSTECAGQGLHRGAAAGRAATAGRPHARRCHSGGKVLWLLLAAAPGTHPAAHARHPACCDTVCSHVAASSGSCMTGGGHAAWFSGRQR